MKETELRKGNLISDGFFTYKVGEICFGIIKGFSTLNGKDIYPDSLYSLNIENVQGISLTELWFEKFGFKSIGLNGQVFEHKNLIGGNNRFVIETDCNIFYPKINFDDCCFGEFKYVHQLQNLYFALTGKELIIKL